jgi:hypothetical protein
MSTRIDGLPENNLISNIHDMRTAVDDLKRAQRTGTTALNIFLNQSASAYDKTFILGANPNPIAVTFIVTFTAAVQDYAIASLIFRVFIGNSTTEFHPNGPGGIPNYPAIKISERIPTVNAKRVTIWDVKVTSSDFATEAYYLKFVVQSTDRGGITVT